jgi:hypothetical protein
MQTKFNYSTGGEFLNPDLSPFVGYFNINDNQEVFTGKYFNNNSYKLLTLISEYSADYYKSQYFKDRYVFDELTLPYSLDEILIQPNEIVAYTSLNKKLRFLHENLIYMYSKLFMGSTDVPFDQNVNTLCNPIHSEEFGWQVRTPNKTFAYNTLSSVSSLSSFKEYDNIKRFVVIPFVDNTGVSILGISNTHLMCISSKISEDGQLSNGGFTLYTDIIDNYSNQKCQNLEDISYDGEFLYISDSQINGGGQVFKYDIKAYTTNDDVYNNKDYLFESNRYLVETIGGIGDIQRINKFDGCSVLGSRPNELWVYDSGNNSIKLYDKNFVWKKTIKIPSIRKYKILDIRHRLMNNHVYALFEDSYDSNNMQYGLFEYDESNNFVNTYVFEDILYDATDKGFRRVAISEQDSNVFYVITQNTIYKKFFSKPEKTFAVFERNKFAPDDTFVYNLINQNWEDVEETWGHKEFYDLITTNDIYISSSNKNKDDFYFSGNSYISHLNERTEYLSLLQHDNLPYYNYERIKFENTEYNQSWVLNKEFYKLFSNIIQFKNNLKGRFYAEFNNYGDLTYKDYIYITDEEINTLDIELGYNSFINDNELIQPNVINRLFRKIYEFQTNLLNLTKVKFKNLKTWVDLENGSNIYPID